MSTLAVNTITNAAGGNTAQINGMTPTADSLQGFRNRVINGSMVIDQRNAGASVTANNNVYAVDRFRTYMSQSSKGTIQQNAGAVTPPAGFSNYLGFTSTSAYSVLSSDHFVITQYVEGFNTADLAFGTANASSVTLSFWVRSSLTGTFGGSLENSAFNRSYPFSYTISSANTWEQKSVTIAGDTSGTWVGGTNGIGLRVHFSLGAGATLSGTAGSWAAADYQSATGATSVVGTDGATFYITGVQLEAGSVATPFERRPYGTELALCQRYYYKIKAIESGTNIFGVGRAESTTSATSITLFFKTTMRVAPTALETTGTAGDYAVRFASGGNTTCNSVPSISDTTVENATVTFSVASGLTAGQAVNGRAVIANAFLAWSAEL
jgi:hypothetical protein